MIPRELGRAVHTLVLYLLPIVSDQIPYQVMLWRYEKSDYELRRKAMNIDFLNVYYCCKHGL